MLKGKIKKRYYIIILAVIIVLAALVCMKVFNKSHIVFGDNSENSTFWLMFSPNSRHTRISYYVTVSNDNILYYKIGYDNSIYEFTDDNGESHRYQNLGMYIFGYKNISKDYITDVIAEGSIKLDDKTVKKFYKLADKAIHYNTPSPLEIHIYDDNLKYFWYEGKYYDASGMFYNDLGFEQYEKMTAFLFNCFVMYLPEEINADLRDNYYVLNYAEIDNEDWKINWDKK